MLKSALISIVASVVVFAAEPKPGDVAPEIPSSIKDSNGKVHSLKEYNGKYVVLEWLNHGCPFVKKHYNSGNMQKLQKEMTSQGVIWLSVISSAPGKQGYSSPEQANKDWKEKKASPTAILLDEGGALGKLYGATTTPNMFIINPKGKLVYKGAIDDKDSTDLEDIPKATNYVKAAYELDKAGKTVKVAATKPYGCSVKYP